MCIVWFDAHCHVVNCAAVSPNLNFRPTATTPSLQRIGEVDKGGVAEMSGLRGGDHILEVRTPANSKN